LDKTLIESEKEREYSLCYEINIRPRDTIAWTELSYFATEKEAIDEGNRVLRDKRAKGYVGDVGVWYIAERDRHGNSMTGHWVSLVNVDGVLMLQPELLYS
jgi:hypothetical protein